MTTKYLIKKPEVIQSAMDVYTVQEVADILKVSRRTIERLMYDTRKLKYLKVGRQARIRKRDIQIFLDQAVI